MSGLFAAAVAPGNLTVPHINYTALMPELILMGGALLLLAAGALSIRHLPTVVYTVMTCCIGVAALASGVFLWHKIQPPTGHPFLAVGRAMVIDGFSTAFVILAACVIIVSSLIADGYLRREGVVGPEYHALALFGAAGAMFMASANDLIVIFLALEIMSIPLYILAAMDQRRAESGEAGMKYFVLGAFSSAIFVYGIALTYGATGSTNLAQISGYLASNVSTNDGLLLAGAALLLVGFLFKVAAVPFHMWTPDVYQGAPTPATGFMAAIAKVGGFAALVRVFLSTFPSLASDWQPVLWVICVLTLVLGAVMGLVQRDVKRMLAYSSINHAGFILLGLQAASVAGAAASLYYVFVYAFMVLGSFAVILIVGGRGDRDHSIESYRGLARRAPVLALAFAVLLLAQAGAPFTTGFLGKLYVVEASVQAHSYALAVIAMLTGAIAAAFYLRVVFVMFGGTELEPTAADGTGAGEAATAEVPSEVAGATTADVVAAGPTAGAVAVATRTSPVVKLAESFEIPLSTAIGLGIAVGVTVVFGIWPGPLFAFAHAAHLLY